jgi:hypothetical protein
MGMDSGAKLSFHAPLGLGSRLARESQASMPDFDTTAVEMFVYLSGMPSLQLVL